MKKIIFTNPPQCVYPTQDNIEGNLVVSKGDYIIKSDNCKYMAIELLGTGTFGQVFRCVSNEGDEVAIKVVKSPNNFYQYEMTEVRILKKLKDLGITEHFVELFDAFIYKQHLCIVVELLGKNMYDLTKILKFKGMDYGTLRPILRQVLEGLSKLQSIGIVHGDLKPENILISDIFNLKVKIIDFGSSSTKAVSSLFYAQSRFYRAPEVILGIPYSCAIDTWSFGCIAYEFLMGHPLFPGTDNRDQIHRMHEFFSDGIPMFMIEHGIHSHEFFEKENRFFTRNNPAKITDKMVINKIYAKCGNTSETDLFIDLFMKSINPSYLERATPIYLLSHPFFKYSSDKVDFSNDQDRYSGTKIPVPESGPRKNSMFNYGGTDFNTDYISQRKGSVYDLNDENRSNKM